MALMDQQSNNPYDQQINKNQYLTGDPNTQNNANTVWMDPNKATENTGINGGAQQPTGNISQQQPNPPSQVSNGTMLGSIAAGNVSQYAPPGFDQGKWNDPNKHDPKYDVGRILSKYPSSTEGLQAAMAELGPMGYRMSGKDTIVGPDGIPVDVGFAFGSGQGAHWQWNPNDPNSQPGSFLGSLQGNQQGNQNQMQNQIWQAMLAQRAQAANQQFNPVGQIIPSGGLTTMPMNQPQQPINFNYNNSAQSPPQLQFSSMLQPQIGQPTPDANGYYGGWQDANGIRHPGNRPGMSYLT